MRLCDDVDQLPHAHGRPTGGARFKQRPEDFRVTEIPGFEFSGEGEHVCLLVRKTGLTTPQAIDRIVRHFGIPRRDVGYAGLKDKQAVTEQWLSVRTGIKHDLPFAEIEDESLVILDRVRNRGKIRRGSHKGNRFAIRLTDVAAAPDVQQRAGRIRARGVPNYFGAQRFGIGGGNLPKAERMLRGEIRVRDRFKRGMYLSAARAHVFNNVLAERVRLGHWNDYLAGDVMSLDGAVQTFVPESCDETLRQRLETLDVHPSGPLWGDGPSPASAGCAELENAVAAACPALTGGLAAARVSHERRALRAKVADLAVVPESGGRVMIEFSLARGVYATSVLRELADIKTTGEQPE